MKQLSLIIISILFVACSSEDDSPPPTLAEVSTSGVVDITQTSAKSGGEITSSGGEEIIAKGVVWSTDENPTIDLQTKTNDGTGDSNFNSSISNLDSGITYFIRAYATNSVGTAYGNELTFETNPGLASITTTEVRDITANSAVSGGEIISNGVGEITEKGIVWSIQENPTVDLETKTIDGIGDGSFTSSMDDLSAETTYYVRAYAVNGDGTAYGQEINFTTLIEDAAEYPEGTVFCDDVITKIVDVTNPTTGKTWMDRNLGASQVATSSTDAAAYGDLYQWGRGADGHQCRDSQTTSNLSSTDQPGHGDFIYNGADPFNWRDPENNNLWQGVNGVNNPCPSGYRLPTEAELDAERSSWNQNNSAGAFASPLKFPVAGFRTGLNGSLVDVGSLSGYWSSTVTSNSLNNQYRYRALGFDSSNAYMRDNAQVGGYSVRCLKD